MSENNSKQNTKTHSGKTPDKSKSKTLSTKKKSYKATKSGRSSKAKTINPKTIKPKKRSKKAQSEHGLESHKKDVMEEIFSKKEDRSVVSKKTAAGASAVRKKAKSANDKSSHQRKAKKDVRKRQKAEYLATLPKSPTKRFLHRLAPGKVLKYIFSVRGLFMFMKLSAAGVIFLVILVGALFAYYRRGLNIDDLQRRSQEQTTVFYDRTGNTVLYELYNDKNRKIIPFEDMSQYVKDATVAIEDRDFYNHDGFSIRGIARATVNNVTGDGGDLQGGSTITQQFIKNSLLTNERKINRKIKELILSVELERKYSKDEILELYLNEVAYGGQAYGIEVASQTYFDKSAKDLTLDEAALLAALPQQPGNFNPYSGVLRDKLPDRQKVVLQNMADEGHITQEEADAAKKVDTLAKLVPLEEQNSLAEAKAPHFVLEVKRQLDERYGAQVVASSGMKVITTIDLELQSMAEKAVSDNIYLVDNAGGNNAALTSADSKTGQVLAMVGSRDFNHEGFGSFNAATAYRQPGSSFKPYAYATLFKSPEWGPGSVMYDVGTDFGGGYEPENYCRCFSGPTTIRRSLGQSLNIPAVKAGYIAGIDNIIDQSEAMGVDVIDQDFYGLSATLGANEVRLVDHVAGYTTLANNGIQNDSVFVLEITYPNGEILQSWENTTGEKVLDKQITYLITDMLSDVGNSLSRSYFIPGVEHTVKTGTTDGAKDGWMMGYSGCLTTGVWMGHNDNIGLATDFTGSVAGFLWRQYMTNAHTTLDGRDCSLQDQPAEIKTVTLDKVTGKIPSTSTRNGTVTDKFPSWYKPAAAANIQTNTYDSVSGLLATSCTPNAARVTYSSGGINPEIPPTDPSYNAWLSPVAALASNIGVPIGGNSSVIGKDDVHDCDDVKPSVSVATTQVSGDTYKVTTAVTKGTHPLEQLTVTIDGDEVKTFNVSSSSTRSFNYAFTSGSTSIVRASVTDTALYSDSSSTSVSPAAAAPAPPATVSAIGVSGSSSNSLVTWSSEPSAASYRVCVDDNNPPSTCFIPSGTATSYSPAGLSGTNFVYVEALDSSGALIAGSTSSIATIN